jgi:hypothetical protein
MTALQPIPVNTRIPFTEPYTGMLTPSSQRFMQSVLSTLTGTTTAKASTIVLSNGPTWSYGTGSPETVVFGNIGDLYSNMSGGAGVTLYVKESGTNTNTGWKAK